MVRNVMTGLIFPKWMSLVGSGMVLLWGLCTVVSVTAADQVPTATTDRRILNKADQGTKR